MNLMVAGLGNKSASDYCDIEMLNERLENARVAAGAAINAMKGFKIDTVIFEDLPNCSRAIAEGAYLAQWRYRKTDQEKMPQNIQLKEESDVNSEWDKGMHAARAQNWARFLMETPANLMTPQIFCHMVTEMLEPLGVKCETFGEDWIKEEGMGAFWSVAKGSDEEPKFLQLEYNGPTEGNGKTVCLVGKGVTFDAGGISIKVLIQKSYRNVGKTLKF
jgi:aminopeptidase